MSADWLLGIEIGGTKLQLGLGRPVEGLQTLERRRVEPQRGATAILEQIREAFQTLLGRIDVKPEAVQGVGVGFGGPVDVDRGVIQTSYQVPGWTDFPLAQWIQDQLRIPSVLIQNDADTAGLAEARYGAGVGCSPLLYLTLGSGIGGALILDGRIYRGTGLGAMEIGHLEVIDLSRKTPRVAELEKISSGWGIAREAQTEALDLIRNGQHDWIVLRLASGNARDITAEIVGRAAIEGDGRADAILDRARRALAFALRQVIALLAPRRIVLGGGVSLIGESHWFAPLRRLVEAEVFPPFRGSYDIVPAALGEEVVVHGALALARDSARTQHRRGSP
jgi:glucokinase